MSSERLIFPDAAATAEACAAAMAETLRGALELAPLATLAVSGGTAIKLLFPRLVAAGLPWERVHVFWVDERSVPPEHEQSNYRLAKELLLGPARIPRDNIHRIPAELPAAEAAAQYMADIGAFLGLAPGELPRFDVIHHGMGPDAHTASLFPGEPLIADRAGVAAAVYVEKMAQWRITLLPGVLQRAGRTVFFVTGAEKAEAARAVLEGEYEPVRFPSQVVDRNAARVTWFLDEGAAARLGAA